ncbi:hypothetical protein MMC07_000416 [Pseudocyphellaria aurata]|nr:hypothetical protein [Pseudocyphellaria aurata]
MAASQTTSEACREHQGLPVSAVPRAGRFGPQDIVVTFEGMQPNAQRLHMKGCVDGSTACLLHAAPKHAGARCCLRRLVKAQAAPAVAAPEKRKQPAKTAVQPAQDRQNGASQRAEPAQLREEVLDVDSVLQKELSENGGLQTPPHAARPRSTRRTKIICTIGPATSSEVMLETLAVNGMNVARLNMCHGDHEWHRSVIDRIHKLNKEKGSASLNELVHRQEGQDFIFTIRDPSSVGANALGVSYDAFVDDIQPVQRVEARLHSCSGAVLAIAVAYSNSQSGKHTMQERDLIVVDGGMVVFKVDKKAGPDVHVSVIDPGIILSRANLTFHRQNHIVRARNAMLPVLSSKVRALRVISAAHCNCPHSGHSPASAASKLGSGDAPYSLL